ncbi:MAG: glycosyltransferase family 2 protein [Clostridia bacterium]|nr:glycosyltransferase family 2 protein [Clostridia bacterium]
MSRLIVSFTSFPARIDSVKTVLDSLYQQTLQADEIILWLAEEQFPNGEADLPLPLREDLEAKRFTLRWCDDLGSHKKYFYAMQEYPEDIIVTVDDDTYYHPDTLQTLMETHTRFPRAVVAKTASLVLFDPALCPLPISEWLFDFQLLTEPSMLLMSIGAGGVLYPPHSVSKKIFDKSFILEMCTANGMICGDDLLLKAGEMLNRTPVATAKSKPYYNLPNTSGTALAKLMPKEIHKDLLILMYQEKFQDAFDNESAQRLKTAVSDFDKMDNKYGLRKKYWLSRPLRDFERQFAYLIRHDAPTKPDTFDYKRIQNVASFAAKVFTAYPPACDDLDDEAAKALSAFRKKLLDIPGIAEFAKTDAVIKGFVDYGVALNKVCIISFHSINIYMQSLKNWQSFMSANPECDPILRKGYEDFLADTKFQIGRANSILSKAEIYEWMLAYADALNDYKKLQMKISRE